MVVPPNSRALLTGFRHILTGLGVYYYIQFLLYLRICLEGNGKRVNFVWEYGMFPHVDRKDGGKSNGIAKDKSAANGLKKE